MSVVRPPGTTGYFESVALEIPDRVDALTKWENIACARRRSSDARASEYCRYLRGRRESSGPNRRHYAAIAAAASE